MPMEPFLTPKLVGGRFDDHAIPLEVLKDLAVLEEMIVEVAKAKFLEDNPKRRRSPRGFTEGIELKLTGVREGSAVPTISIAVADSTLFPQPNQIYFERARDAIINAIWAAEHQRSPTAYLPETTLNYFDRLGRSLRNGEAIEFSNSARPEPARLTRGTRRTLLLASPKVQELTEETTERGTVPEADQDAMRFELQLLDGRKVKAPIAAQHFDTVLEAFSGYKTGMRVLLKGIGRFDRNERLLGFESIEHVSALDPLDVPTRLEELRTLEPGWCEGSGQTPSHSGLDWLSSMIEQYYPDDLPLPHLYPTLEGGVQAEWSIDSVDMTLEIDLAAKSGSWHALNMATEEEGVRDVDLGNPGGWRWLNRELQQLIAKSA